MPDRSRLPPAEVNHSRVFFTPPNVYILGDGPLVSQVAHVVAKLRPLFRHAEPSAERLPWELGRIYVACCDGERFALEPLLLNGALTRADTVILVGHERPCQLCLDALLRGAAMWIPEALLEMQLTALMRHLLTRGGPCRAAEAPRLDPSCETVTLGNRRYVLRSADYRLLTCLVEHHGQWVSELELLRKVFQNSSKFETSLVRVHIYTLRRSLGLAASCVQSKRGCGYRFVYDTTPDDV